MKTNKFKGMVKYNFHIIDTKYNVEYDYNAYFASHKEAADFIRDNRSDGNIIKMIVNE